MSISFSSNTQNINNTKEYRCPKCYLIPFINISTNNNKLFMEIECTNNHKDSKPFEQMQINCKTNSILNNSCTVCENENNKNIFNILYYCSNCYKFYCKKHGEIHKLKDKHKIFYIKNFDINCFEHDGNSFVGYCSNHNRNYCFRCNCFEENNKNFEEDLKDEQINYYENEMNKNIKIIKEIEIMFNNYKKLFKELEKNIIIFKDNINKRINFNLEIIN